MMLRSSSTPILGSLISPETPNNHHHHHETTLKPSPIHKSQHFTTLSCSSSPIGNGGIRRAQSEGNLENLLNSTGTGAGEEFNFFNPHKKISSRIHTTHLETIPSFSYQNSRFKSEEEDDDDDDDDSFGDFQDFKMENKVMSLNKQLGFGNLEIKDEIQENGSQMYLAKGIGVDSGFGCGDGGGGRNLSQAGHGGGGGGGDDHDVEEHYKKMVIENPGNSLFLGNYAQFLYQSKQDLQGAEEYYSRAILIDPNDGEILSKYAKILWELHHDKDRAISYFERAIQAASEDSHVHAAYASFLWEVEGEEEEGYYGNIPPIFSNGTMASATA